MSIWQFIGYAAAATGVAIGVTALACEGIVRFLEWMYPDAPDEAVILSDSYLDELGRRAATFSESDIIPRPVHGAAFGTGKAAE